MFPSPTAHARIGYRRTLLEYNSGDLSHKRGSEGSPVTKTSSSVYFWSNEPSPRPRCLLPGRARVRTPGEGTGPTLPTLLVWQPRERTVRHHPYQTAMPHAVLQRGNQRRGEGRTAQEAENCRKLRNANSGKSSSGLWGDTRISPPKPAGPSPHGDESGDGLTIPRRGMKTNRGERPVG